MFLVKGINLVFNNSESLLIKLPILFFTFFLPRKKTYNRKARIFRFRVCSSSAPLAEKNTKLKQNWESTNRTIVITSRRRQQFKCSFLNIVNTDQTWKIHYLESRIEHWTHWTNSVLTFFSVKKLQLFWFPFLLQDCLNLFFSVRKNSRR